MKALTDEKKARKLAYNREYSRKYREANRAKVAEYVRAYGKANRSTARVSELARYRARPEHFRGKQKRLREELRAEFLRQYGGKCACCGESIPRFLTLDHVNSDGTAHRSSLKGNGAEYQLRDLRARGWPKDGYAIMCWNCNVGRKLNGGICPHITARQMAMQSTSLLPA